MDTSGSLQNAGSALSQLTFNANSLESPGPFLPGSVHTNTMHYNTWQPPHSGVLPFVNQPSPIPSKYSTPLGTPNQLHEVEKGSGILQKLQLHQLWFLAKSGNHRLLLTNNSP